MMIPEPEGFLTLDFDDGGKLSQQRLEYRWFGPGPSKAPTIVLLHEGLGSAGLWGDFPSELARQTGCGVFVYSRAGYGASSIVSLPRAFSYMHDEALIVLPRLLETIGFARGLLLGSSDGASIATIYAGTVVDPRVAGLVLIAPHFFVERETVAGAAAARVAYDSGDLRAKLARWHSHVDVAFRGWNDAWLDPSFAKSWNITEALPSITSPILIVQGERDEYGTSHQIAAAENGCFGEVRSIVMPGIGHQPQREALAATCAAVAEFAAPLLAGPART